MKKASTAYVQALNSDNPRTVLPLLVPHSRRFLEKVMVLDQSKTRRHIKAGLDRRIHFFSILRLCLSRHVRKVFKLARQLVSLAVDHALKLQEIRLSQDYSVDFWGMLKKLHRRVGNIISQWLKMAPSDRKIFRGFYLEKMLLGIAATVPV